MDESNFAEILFPYKSPEKIDHSIEERGLRISKVLFKKDENYYLVVSRQCKDHSEKTSLIQKFYFQYQCSHPAIMPLTRLSLTPNNSFEACYTYPEMGKLSNFIGFSHEDISTVKANTLTPTNKSIISYGIAHALRYIHELGYQFCDVNAKNVYLDSNFHPFLTNFYSIRKLDDSTKESRKNSLIQIKTDIFSYSIIYAALIEPITFDPPIQSPKEFYQNISNRKRPVCTAATDNQRTVLDKMWDYVPRDRINFDQIIEYFDQGDLIFPGTEMEEFNDYKRKISSFDISKFTPPSTPVKGRFLSTSSSASSSSFSSTFSSPSKSPSPKPSPSIIRKIACDVIDNE